MLCINIVICINTYNWLKVNIHYLENIFEHFYVQVDIYCSVLYKTFEISVTCNEITTGMIILGKCETNLTIYILRLIDIMGNYFKYFYNLLQCIYRVVGGKKKSKI